MSEFKRFVDLHKFNFVNMHPAMNLNQWVIRVDDVEILVNKLDAERKRAELAELTVSQKREQIASCEAALDEANKRADEAEAKLYKIVRTPVIPFPDPGAHSERAFSDALYRAWSDIQRIARNREVKNG